MASYEWEATYNKLVSHSRGLSLASVCVLCMAAEESVNHLFFQCSYSAWLCLVIEIGRLKATEGISTTANCPARENSQRARFALWLNWLSVRLFGISGMRGKESF